MATEATEVPLILYETLAPLGEADDDQSSFQLPFKTSNSKIVEDNPKSGAAVKSVDVVSSDTSFVSVNVRQQIRRGFEENLALSVHQSNESRDTGASSDNEQETVVSARATRELKDVSSFTLETVENQMEVVELSSSRDDEEIGFLSLEPEDSVDTHPEDQGRIKAEHDLILLESVNRAPKEVPPWARTGATHGTWFRSPFLQLHQEIVDFCNFVTPTEKEQKIRDDAVQRVREVVMSIWPSCQVKVFGSFATGLYLPTSDVDVVILESGCQVPQDGLKALAKALNRKNLVKNLQVIGKARVPIVKFVEADSNIPFDISFDVANGPEAADFIREAMINLPPLKPLCMVLKIFLQQRELNEVYTGGIGSYALLVMLLTHLQMHPSRKNFNSRGEPCPLESNLGVLLVDFFDFYGRALNVRDVGISCRSGGRFFCKRSRGFADNGRPFLLSVEDPQKPDNDIGKNSYNVTKVRSAFVLAHRLLTKLEVEDVPEHVGLLGRIVRMDNVLTTRDVVLPELPPRLPSAKKLSGNPSSSGVSSEKGILTPEVVGRSRWHEDEDFPRGGDSEKLSRKRKRAKDRAEKISKENSLPSPVIMRTHKRKRGEVPQVSDTPGSSSVRGRKSKIRKELEIADPVPSSSCEVKLSVKERLGPIEKPLGKGKSAKQPKVSKRDFIDLTEDVEEQSTHVRSNKRSKRHQREDSHEEGEITLEDDATFGRVGNRRDLAQEDEVDVGAGNGHNKHKRWFSETKVRNRQRGEQAEEVITRNGRISRKIMVTNAHKKITFS
ncbi:non-canonical poly(A) RNA polymerase PAPD5/7 [Marchantia polymorpha subsp. ruderalis]|uniref:polynucleotide adenylyltransferase n=2 Tax=Marchantia polymorpha TaxID=3197 RepID=A0A176WRZ7_MARPO|nr:hypothetical protein AXG93_1356s1160 [Marchantia polymorpha subsp. ruderalis]PTQ47992.1 hypothetical protein MARPO_0006s0037 [Marchantia polymorpha]BBN04554.1 hypothetical protein Mp_3g05650 [Marchantia polymorpha subsp. ruderalis]|eukprot:PTQ47992.1 hypothetical protein MARPO_0006s0037 [Marchantia polymorpha]